MRALRTTLIAVNSVVLPFCVAISFSATTVHAQSALPEFSNPYGGSAALVHADTARPSAQKSTRRSSTKHIARKVSAHKVPAHKIARKQPIATSHNAASDLEIPKAASTPPAIARDLVAPQTKSKDSALDFGLQWSAADDPHYNTSTSTIPALSEIQRNANETPAETGSSIEAGMKLKF